MATMAHTDDSSPLLTPESTAVAGPPVAADSAISCTGLVSVDVKYSVMRDAICASTRPPTTAPNMRQPTFEIEPPFGLPTYTSANTSVPMIVRMPAVRKPRLIGAIALLSFSVARTEKTPTIDASTPMRASAEREQRAGRPQRGLVREDRRERGNAEDDRRDQRHLVRLEQVGRHTGAVTDVVTDVVGDRRRVARVVFGDTGFDLADEVGADVGRLREDAAADSQEQREQRTTEAEPDQDRRARVLEDHDDRRRAEQAEADREHAGDTAGAERDLERLRHRSAARRRRGAHVAAHGEAHADEAGEARQEATEHERRGAEAARLAGTTSATPPFGVLHRGRGEEHDDRERHEDHGDRLELPLQVGHRAFLNRLGDLLHLRRCPDPRRARGA